MTLGDSATVTDQPERYDEAARVLNDAMEELDLLKADVIRLSGVSDYTVRKLASAVPNTYRRANLTKIAKAVQLPPDTFTKLVPVVTPQPKGTAAPTAASVDRRVTQLAQLLHELTERVDAQGDEIRKLRGRPSKPSGRATPG